jgi:GDP-D-mannose dehydratase
MKKALVTGITGQDGSIRAELSLSKGCEARAHPRVQSLLDVSGCIAR